MALLGQRAGLPLQPHRFAAPLLLCPLLHPADMLWLSSHVKTPSTGLVLHLIQAKIV